MPGYDFAPGITACRPGEQLILLDLPNDRYFALAAEKDAALSRLIARDALADDDATQIRQLAAQGLLVPTPDPRLPILCHPGILPTGEMATGDRLASGWRTTQAIGGILQARASLRLRGFARAIDRLRNLRATTLDVDHSRLEAIVSAFRAAGHVVSLRDHCLPHSLALARRLLRARLDVHLIVGVSIQPFRAHCWVQADERLLIDELDAVRQFTPILIV